jgi:ABC-type glycerol-3-phosphate transport system permease component
MGLEDTQRQVRNLTATFSRRAWLPRRFSLSRIAQYALLIVALFLSLLVLLVTLNIALRPRIAVLADFWGLPLPPYWNNFRWAWSYLRQPLSDTLLIIGSSVLGILLFAAPASYALARIRFPGRRIIFYLFLAFVMIPPAILLTPNFILAVQWGLKGTVHGLVLFYVGGGQAFAIFLITTFFRTHEPEIFEAARIDGATELQALRFIAVPLAWPILITVGIVNCLGLYSDLVWPSLMLPQDVRTVMIALNQVDPIGGAASFLLASAPQLMLFIVAMKYFAQGLTSGALKA